MQWNIYQIDFLPEFVEKNVVIFKESWEIYFPDTSFLAFWETWAESHGKEIIALEEIPQGHAPSLDSLGLRAFPLRQILLFKPISSSETQKYLSPDQWL